MRCIWNRSSLSKRSSTAEIALPVPRIIRRPHSAHAHGPASRLWAKRPDIVTPADRGRRDTGGHTTARSAQGAFRHPQRSVTRGAPQAAFSANRLGELRRQASQAVVGGALARFGDGPWLLVRTVKAPAGASSPACKTGCRTALHAYAGVSAIGPNVAHPSTQHFGTPSCGPSPVSGCDDPSPVKDKQRTVATAPLSGGAACAPAAMPVISTCSSSR